MNNKLIKALIPLGFLVGIAAVVLSTSAARAAMPWGTIYNQATASPVCTSFASAPVCIIDMTANIGGISISGDPGTTLNHNATLILQQDGTGSRTVVGPTNLVDANGVATTLPSPTSTAANKYTAYSLHYNTTTSKYQVTGQYDNYPLTNFEFSTTQSFAAATIGPTAAVAQATIVAPGMTTSSTCLCVPNQATNPIQFSCIPQTNAIQCQAQNMTGGTITATTATLNVRGMP